MNKNVASTFLLLSALPLAHAGTRVMEPKDIPAIKSQGQELYLGLRKLGVSTEFVTYPREPHGFREPNHQVDKIERELAWFEKWGVK
jgi:acetyl esterase/lipase